MKVDYSRVPIRHLPNSPDELYSNLVESPAPQKHMTWFEVLKLAFDIVAVSIAIIPLSFIALYNSIFPPKQKSIRGKVALVSGAARGLGRGLALELAKQGCKVACVDINLKGAMETVELIKEKNGTAYAYEGNVGSLNSIKETKKKIDEDLGVVNILVNNASIIISNDFDESDEFVQGFVNVNFLSYYRMIKVFLPDMKTAKDGHVVFIASIASFVGLANVSMYTACKWALRGLIESFRDEMVQSGHSYIKSTIVHPNFINTSATYSAFWNARLPDLSVEEVASKTVQGIKKEEFSITIPGFSYYLINIIRLLPEIIQTKFGTALMPKIGCFGKDLRISYNIDKAIESSFEK